MILSCGGTFRKSVKNLYRSQKRMKQHENQKFSPHWACVHVQWEKICKISLIEEKSKKKILY